jgi:hypothetical protein
MDLGVGSLRYCPECTVPFMVVFFDVPKNISSYQLAADKAQ